MDEKDWLIIKILKEKLSITKTAQALFMSQPSLSSRINQIESRFRVRIVIRSKQGVKFTPEGEILVKYAELFLRQMRSVEDDLNAISEFPGGILRIASTPFFSKRILPELLIRFKEKHPTAIFDVITCASSEAVDKINSMEVNIAFVRGEYSWSGCGKKMLFSEQIYICSQQPLNFAQLPSLPRIEYPNVQSAQELQDKWWKEHYAVAPCISLRVDNSETCYEMVTKGLGYAFLPSLFFGQMDNLNTYPLYFKNQQPLTRKTWLYYNKDTQNLKNIKLFIDLINKYKFIN